MNCCCVVFSCVEIGGVDSCVEVGCRRDAGEGQMNWTVDVGMV